jgi:hypothetical protein
VKAIADDDNYFHYWPTLSSDLRLLSRKHSRERSWPSFLYITIAAAAVTRSKLFFSPLYGLLLKSWVSLARSHTIAIIITTFIRNCVYPKKLLLHNFLPKKNEIIIKEWVRKEKKIVKLSRERLLWAKHEMMTDWK